MMMKHIEKVRGAVSPIAISVAMIAVAGGLTGCGLGGGSEVKTAVPGGSHATLHGSVFGGQQPVSGAVIQLYAPGTSGYGSAATALIASTITSGPGGSFDITGDYTCPSAGTQVYLTATGGNSGSGNNANLALMAALGSCGNLGASTFVSINELTTVASVWALAPFMTGPANVGTSSANATGLTNAFTDVTTLVNSATGSTTGTALPSGATAPIAEINTLADILATCVNSVGGTGSGTPCGMLFAAATPSGGSAPGDTITAAVDIAKNPGHNVNTLYNLSSAAAPFQPTLATAPNDFTIAVNFSGGSLNAPSALAADANGNVWIANGGGNTVTELAHTGAVLSGTGYMASLNAPSAIAFDIDGTVWITNRGNNTVSRLSGAGAVYNGSPYSGGGLNGPNSIAFDSLGTAWISNGGSNSVTTITSAGAAANYAPAGAGSPLALGVNPH